MGYTGVEFAQNVRALPTALDLKAKLDKEGLKLIGLSGGGLSARSRYARNLSPEYLYLDEWDELGVADALSSGFLVGLHPHRDKNLERLSDAEAHLGRFPGLRLVLDTAHQYLAGDDIVSAISKHADRIVAVHLKDWREAYGTSSMQFALGFSALGTGDLQHLIRRVIRKLAEVRFRGWLVIEQDTPHGDPFVSAATSLKWLKKNLEASGWGET